MGAAYTNVAILICIQELLATTMETYKYLYGCMSFVLYTAIWVPTCLVLGRSPNHLMVHATVPNVVLISFCIQELLATTQETYTCLYGCLGSLLAESCVEKLHFKEIPFARKFCL